MKSSPTRSLFVRQVATPRICSLLAEAVVNATEQKPEQEEKHERRGQKCNNSTGGGGGFLHSAWETSSSLHKSASLTCFANTSRVCDVNGTVDANRRVFNFLHTRNNVPFAPLRNADTRILNAAFKRPITRPCASSKLHSRDKAPHLQQISNVVLKRAQNVRGQHKGKGTPSLQRTGSSSITVL